MKILKIFEEKLRYKNFSSKISISSLQKNVRISVLYQINSLYLYYGSYTQYK